MSPRPNLPDPIESILAGRCFEEDAEISEQDAASMRFHAQGLRARCRYVEDLPHPNDKMITISVRWARTLAKALEGGADARELFDA
jgi:hypothetical protein